MTGWMVGGIDLRLLAAAAPSSAETLKQEIGRWPSLSQSQLDPALRSTAAAPGLPSLLIRRFDPERETDGESDQVDFQII